MSSKCETVLIAGGSGFLGQKIAQHLIDNGHTVRILSRKPQLNQKIRQYFWNPSTLIIDDAAFENVTVLINLAGSNIAKRWTDNYLSKILDSRLESIHCLCHYLKTKNIKLSKIISSSAIGYYGDQEDTLLSESSSSANNTILSEVCAHWESKANSLKEFCTFFHITRIGLVMDAHEGIWPKLKLATPFYIIPLFNKGKMKYSWIHIEDVLQAFKYITDNNISSSILNLTAPNPCSLKSIYESYEKFKGRTFLYLNIPTPILKLFLGKMSELMITSCNATPNNLLREGFVFKYSNIEHCISSLN